MPAKLSNLTVRDMIKRLADYDPDMEVCTSILNSDPVPLVDIDEGEDGVIVLMDEKTAGKDNSEEEGSE